MLKLEKSELEERVNKEFEKSSTNEKRYLD
jgi:hypothetical protein